MDIKDWFKSASATFAGGAVAISLLAIPTFIWLPREFDAISTKLDMTLQVSTEARNNSQAAIEALESMKLSIAKMDSEQINELFISVASGEIVTHPLASNKLRDFTDLLPIDVLTRLISGKNVSLFSYSNFADRHWVFVDQSDFSKISAEDQRFIVDSFERSHVNFILQ